MVSLKHEAPSAAYNSPVSQLNINTHCYEGGCPSALILFSWIRSATTGRRRVPGVSDRWSQCAVTWISVVTSDRAVAARCNQLNRRLKPPDINLPTADSLRLEDIRLLIMHRACRIYSGVDYRRNQQGWVPLSPCPPPPHLVTHLVYSWREVLHQQSKPIRTRWVFWRNHLLSSPSTFYIT